MEKNTHKSIKTFSEGIQTHYAKSQGYFSYARINVRKVLALDWSTYPELAWIKNYHVHGVNKV